mgnify:CR=1 FL=1
MASKLAILLRSNVMQRDLHLIDPRRADIHKRTEIFAVHNISDR